MPELPEVETIRKDLEKVILNKKITKIDIKKPKLIKNDNIEDFVSDITNNKLKSINRIGKLIYIDISDNKNLLIHLKMTGQLIYQSKNNTVAGGHNWPPIDTGLPNKYSHVIFHFDDDSTLFFNDQRQFGYLKTINNSDLKIIIEDYGIEPLQKNFTLENFKNIFKNRKSNIKSILLNQKIISGLGNIYVDEICFDSGIKPHTLANKLTSEKIKKLHFSTEKIISNAIKYRGTTFSDYVDSKGSKGNFSHQLKVYGRKDQNCLKCKKNIIQKTKLASRGTYFCTNCQK